MNTKNNAADKQSQQRSQAAHVNICSRTGLVNSWYFSVADDALNLIFLSLSLTLHTIYEILKTSMERFIINMETKLTLRLDEEIIKSAKKYAKKNKISVSKMVSGYLQALTDPDEEIYSISPIVKELSGIIPPEIDTSSLVDEYHAHLQEKHR